jgi:hypothetical protein
MAYTINSNQYKQTLGLTLTEIGSLLGVTKEAIRLKLLKHAKWRQLAQQRLVKIGLLESEVRRLRAQQTQVRKHTPPPHSAGYEHIISHSARLANLFQRLGIRDIYAVNTLGTKEISRQYHIGPKSIHILERGLEIAGL